ncbi:hypothetical protein GG344DRAFT_59878, partial [Lentinula edodes]
EVDLNSNSFGVRSVRPVVPFLSNSLSLLMNSSMNSEGGRVAANAPLDSTQRIKSPGLRVLIPSRHRLKDGSASARGEVIAANPRIRRFEIRNTGLEWWHYFRCDRSCKLSRSEASQVVQSYNREDRKSIRGWKAIADLIRAAKSLEFLDVSSCTLRTDGCAEIITLLGDVEHSRLHSIRLANNDFSRVITMYPSRRCREAHLLVPCFRWRF